MGCGKSAPVASTQRVDDSLSSVLNGGNKVSPLVVIDSPRQQRQLQPPLEDCQNGHNNREETSTRLLIEDGEDNNNKVPVRFKLTQWQDLSSKHTQYVDVCVWSPTQDVILTASSDKQCFLWSLTDTQQDDATTTNSVAATQVALEEIVCCADWSSTGNALALGTERGAVVLLDDSGRVNNSWCPHNGMVSCVVISSNFVLSGGDAIGIYSLTAQTFIISCWNSQLITDFELTGDTFLVGMAQGCLAQFPFPANSDQFPTLSSSTEEMDAVVSMDPPLRTYEGHTEGIYKVAKSPTDNVFATCSVDTTIKVWMVKMGNGPIHSLTGHFGYVNDIVWSGNGLKLLSCSFDGSVKVWDPKSGVCLHTLIVHQDRVNRIGLCNNDAVVVSAGNDGVLNYWSVEDGEHLGNMDLTGRIVQMSLNFDHDKLAAASYGTVHLIRPENGT